MADGKDLLLFGLAEERYAVPLTRVREIVGLPTITRLPNTPESLRGVINLRGHVIPVVDMRQQFGLPSVPYHKFTVCIVIEVIGATIGLIVDSVLDVLSLRSEQIEPPPPNVRLTARLDFVSGLAHGEQGTLVLIDVDRMLTDEQTGVLRERMMA